ncbi:hypothetical protein [Clostridium manihotivorum]|uniref:DUF3784 domain-containing protein n=1 Tax=Clostridium manihotivorum TaxID=2320868 RepID=A0A410DMT9_9CLOT|nr:hypothetical protein [Clostridium manihotivorum]QAA30388.1 hypothetical protein C1I91_01090 [Clostridium manihotivorum]
MDSIGKLINYLFIFLGVISTVIAMVGPKKLFISNSKKVNILDKNNYLKSERILFFCIGIIYLLLGAALIHGFDSIRSLLGIPACILVIFDNLIRKKYTSKI